MNERIRELIKQATTVEEQGCGASYDNFNKEKFAELIVRECLLYAKDGDIDFMKFMIKKHFGVGE